MERNFHACRNTKEASYGVFFFKRYLWKEVVDLFINKGGSKSKRKEGEIPL